VNPGSPLVQPRSRTRGGVTLNKFDFAWALRCLNLGRAMDMDRSVLASGGPKELRGWKFDG